MKFTVICFHSEFQSAMILYFQLQLCLHYSLSLMHLLPLLIGSVLTDMWESTQALVLLRSILLLERSFSPIARAETLPLVTNYLPYRMVPLLQEILAWIPSLELMLLVFDILFIELVPNYVSLQAIIFEQPSIFFLFRFRWGSNISCAKWFD